MSASSDDHRRLKLFCENGADDSINARNRKYSVLTMYIRRWLRDMSSQCRLDTNVFECVMVMLVEAGSSVVPNIHGNPLSHFLQLGHAGTLHSHKELQDKFCQCLMLLLSAGCHVSDTDISLMRKLTVLTPGVLEYATTKCCSKPTSLQRMCKIVLRNQVKKPLSKHMCQTGLPTHLQNYLLLKIHD